MKKALPHRIQRRTSTRARVVMTTSFVVTVSAGAALGCRKQPVEPPEPDDNSNSDPVSVYRADYDGACYRNVSVRCPKGVSCNPPSPLQVDCPPHLRDASADVASVARRPPGKEDWLRVTPQLWFVSEKEGCSYQAEYFCTPPKTKVNGPDCTKYPAPVKVRCNFGADAGTKRFEEFVYKDGLGQCRRVPASECGSSPNMSRCLVPDGELVPCPAEP